MFTLKELFIYPLKSARGIALEHAYVEERGLKFDRRWMVVDAQGTFITQRTHSLLARVDVAIGSTGLRLSAPNHGELRLSLYPSTPARRPVVVWDDTVGAMDVGAEASEWISELLGERCTIVFFPDDASRLVDPRFARRRERTAFSDGFPVMVLSQASLDDLNARLAVPLTMERFRPNIVIGGCDAFAEDTWQSIRIGDVVLPIVKPCARCVITTTDQHTAERGIEPLATLARYRNVNGKVLFGQNALVEQTGSIAIGDEVTVM
jgi:uncharacterized protein